MLYTLEKEKRKTIGARLFLETQREKKISGGISLIPKLEVHI